MTTCTPAAARAVRAYYDQTRLDYRLLWTGRRNLSMHFGYHDAGARTHGRALVRMNEVLADRARVEPGDRVLDAGCGIGGSSLWLAGRRGADVVGVTLVPDQAAAATRYARRRGLAGRARFAVADYTATPFPAGSFDVVWAMESLCHAPDKARFHAEAARLLRPGGRLVVAEYVRAGRPLGRGGERELHAWLDGWAIPDIDTAAEHGGHLAAVGFTGIRIDDATAAVLPSLRRLHGLASRTYPLAAAGHRLGLRSAVQHGNVTASVRQLGALRAGLWSYALISAVRGPG